MNTIYAFCGKSGSGKTSLALMVSKKTNIPIIASYTTRPIRPKEKNGFDYHFIGDKEWELLCKTDYLTAKQLFKVTETNVWKYGIAKKDLDKTCIVILTPNGIDILKSLGYNVISIYIDVDDETRFKRIIDRSDNQSKREIKRRSEGDLKDFSSFKPDYIVNNNDDIYYSISQIIKILR